MNGASIDYMADSKGNGLSRGVWATFDEMRRDQYHLYLEHFLNIGDQVSTTIVDGWVSYLDTDCTATVLDDTANGVMRLLCDATGSDEEAAIQWGSSHAPYAVISTAGSEKALWYETRIRLSSVADIQAYIGLADGGVPANGLLADAGTGINDKDFIGFRILEADPDGIDAVYRTTSTEVVHQDEAQVAVASTWYKLGFRYFKDPEGIWRVNYYVDGSVVGSKTLKATDTSFPDGVYMAPLFALKQHAAAEKQLDIDWVAVGMEL